MSFPFGVDNFNYSPNQKYFLDSSSDDQPTAVLLICIYNKYSTLITHDIIYKAFSEYGEIFKILIFEKSKIWKIFIEMDTIISATNAKNKLNNTKILEDGSKMNVYFSSLAKLNFQNSNSGGIDYQFLKAKSQAMKKNESKPFYLSNANPSFEKEQKLYNLMKFKNDLLNFPATFTPPLESQILRVSSKNININNYFVNHEKKKEQKSQTENIFLSKRNSDFQKSEFISLLQENPSLSDKTEYRESFPEYDIPIKPPSSFSKNIEDLTNTHSFSSTSDLMNEKIKQIKRQSVLDKIEFDIQESMNQTIKKSIIDIDEIIRNPKQKINSLPEKRSSINSFAKSFYEEDIINEVGDTREDYMKSKYNSGKSFTTPLIPKNDPKIFSFVNFRQLLPKTTVSVDSMSQKSIDLKFKPTASKNEDMYDLSFDFDPASYVSQQFIKENKKSKVLYVRGIVNENINLRLIYNLFSNYGNIMKMILISSKFTCLIEYENIINSTDAKDNLNNIIIYGTPIRIFYSNYTEIIVKDQEKQAGEIFIGSEESYRFRNSKNMVINPPSYVLHVSNLKKEICTLDNIMNIFCPFGKIENVKFLPAENSKNMCLVKYSKIEESVMAVISLHGIEISGR